jgi:hypothetical protein
MNMKNMISQMTSQGLKTASTTAAIGLTGLAAFFWVNSALAAIPKFSGTSYSCKDHVQNLFLAGSFVMPGSGQPMNLWVGKPQSDRSKVVGYIGKTMEGSCEAQCQIVRFERFQKDSKPALLELSCEGSALKSLRMPLHVQWIRTNEGTDAIVRMGSSIYGTEEAPFHVEVNRYAIASAK